MNRMLPLAFCASGCIGIAPPPMAAVPDHSARTDIALAGGPTQMQRNEENHIGGTALLGVVSRFKLDQLINQVSAGGSLNLVAGDYWVARMDTPVMANFTTFFRAGMSGEHGYLGLQLDVGVLPAHLGLGLTPALRLGRVQFWGIGGLAGHMYQEFRFLGDDPNPIHVVAFLRTGAGVAVEVSEAVSVFGSADALFRPWEVRDLDVADTYQAVAGVQIRVHQRSLEIQ